ncbi:molybdate ABC transporter substrate-binding protein [Raoultella planticola]|uniref:Substrate-binding domain-containing protein n=1 Tax=Klebsiella electrica TaxID=1259973 RepID=A0AAJ5UGL9_9ENTR|nr:substrate-binding domain-containing protein [Klebsiella electrica]WBW63383.1 substrate-binding domain-containing protein [Klebsiella electrica]BBV76086.1 molybdate ABC transporter substrate-binding protein [Raoultella planticola]
MTSAVVLLAAGSLKGAFIPLLARFHQQTGILVEAHFGPAGLLREQIEGGAVCSVFASANRQHPQALRQAGRAGECHLFARNQLMLTARRAAAGDMADWLTLLTNPQLRLATSTPGCDPSGDYTWQLFERIEARFPGVGSAMMARAQPLVGGRQSLSVPPGETAGAWLIREGLTDLFIGYAHYASQMALADDLRTVTIPAPWNIQADYLLTTLDESAGAQRLCRFILGAEGQHALQAAGFLPASAES